MLATADCSNDAQEAEAGQAMLSTSCEGALSPQQRFSFPQCWVMAYRCVPSTPRTAATRAEILTTQLPPLHAWWNCYRERLELPNPQQGVKIWSFWYLWASLGLQALKQGDIVQLCGPVSPLYFNPVKQHLAMMSSKSSMLFVSENFQYEIKEH